LSTFVNLKNPYAKVRGLYEKEKKDLPIYCHNIAQFIKEREKGGLLLNRPGVAASKK